MKKLANYFALFLYISIFSAEALFQDFKETHNGVEHAHVEHNIGKDPVKINLLRIDLTKARLDVKMAIDTVIGTETTSSIAKRHGAIAAINAGFFRLDTSIFAGEPANFLMIDGNILSEGSNDRITLGIKNWPHKSETFFFRPKVDLEIEIAKKKFVINGINREVKTNELIMFTEEFSLTTLSGRDCLELVISGTRITAISASGSAKIPKNGYVLTACGDKFQDLRSIARIGRKIRILQKEEFVSVSHEPDLPIIQQLEDAVAGVSQLVKNGKIDITWEQEKASKAFAVNRHPRTAVAKLKDGKFLMVTVDGRQPGVSVGMSLQELAEYLLSIGAVDAINLDGGGSTTMVLDGKVVNKTSDTNGERKVGDAIIVTLR